MMTSDIPDRYGSTDLVLMVVDPFHFFAYWEVTSESLQQARDVLGAEMEGARAVLRMFDVSLIHFDGTNAHHTFDLDIGLEAHGWYFPLWSADRSYCADLGFVARTGRFYALTRSNVIHTPRAGVSNRADERWMRVRFVRRRKPERERPLEYVPAAERLGGPSRETMQARHQRQAQDETTVQAGLADGTLPTSSQPRSS